MYVISTSNMTIMSFQPKRNIDSWCPRQFNIEIAFNKHAFQMSNQISDLAQKYVAREDNYHSTKRNQSQCYVIYITSMLCYLFCPKNRTTDSRKTFITQEWLVVESCRTPHWIPFLMPYRLMNNIRSHINKLILPWSAYCLRGKLCEGLSLVAMTTSYSGT